MEKSSSRYVPGKLSSTAVRNILQHKTSLGRPRKTPQLGPYLRVLPGWPRPRVLTYKALKGLLEVAALDSRATMRDRNTALWLAAWSFRKLYEKDGQVLGAMGHGKLFQTQCFRDLESREFTAEEYLENLHSLQS
jgi:hypothetical protein